MGAAGQPRAPRTSQGQAQRGARRDTLASAIARQRKAAGAAHAAGSVAAGAAGHACPALRAAGQAVAA